MGQKSTKVSRRHPCDHPCPQLPFARPTGLYEKCEWDAVVITRMVAGKMIAPLYPGTAADIEGTEECPICFLSYPGVLNQTLCCNKPMCSECLLQINKPGQLSTCPFCNSSKLRIAFHGPWWHEEPIVRALEAIEDEKKETRHACSPVRAATTEDSVAENGQQEVHYCTREEREQILQAASAQSGGLGYGSHIEPMAHPISASDASSIHRSTFAHRSEASRDSSSTWSSSRESAEEMSFIEHILLMEAIRRSMVEVQTRTQEPASNALPSYSRQQQELCEKMQDPSSLPAAVAIARSSDLQPFDCADRMEDAKADVAVVQIVASPAPCCIASEDDTAAITGSAPPGKDTCGYFCESTTLGTELNDEARDHQLTQQSVSTA